MSHRARYAFFAPFVVGLALAAPAWAESLPVLPDQPTRTEDLAEATTDTDGALADAVLLGHLLTLLGAAPDARAGHVGWPAAEADPRAIAALRYVGLHDARPDVAEAVPPRLARFGHPAAVAALRDLAVGAEGSRPLPSALAALGRHPLPAAWDELYAIALDTDLDIDLRREALAVLERDHPSLLATRGRPSLGGSALVATAGGTFFGGFALSAVGRFAGNRNAGDIGWVAGGILGAGTGYLLGRHVPDARQQYYLSAMGWGAFSGLLLANATARPEAINCFDQFNGNGQEIFRESRFPGQEFRCFDNSRVETAEAGLSLLGQLGGFGLAWLGADTLRMTSSDVLVANLTGIAATVATSGALGLVDPTEDKRPGYAVLLGGALLGTGVGVAAARHLHFDNGDAALTLLGGAEGMYFGGFLVDLLAPDRDTEAAVALGGGLGVLAAGAVAQVSGMKPEQVGEMLLLSTYGKALGAGMAMLSDAKSDTVNATHLGLGAVGFVAGALLTDQTRYESGDRALVPIATGLGLWHGGLVGVLAEEARRGGSGGNLVGGMILSGGALAGLGAMAVSQGTDMTNWQATMGSSGAVWGAWLSGWSMVLEEPKDATGAATRLLVGTDVGLLVTSLLVSPAFDVDPRVIAGANFGGMALAGVGALLTAMFTEDSDAIVRANLGGSVLGLAVGGALAFSLLPPAAEAVPGAVQGAGSVLGFPAWLSLPIRSVAGAPNFGADGRLDGATVQVGLEVW